MKTALTWTWCWKTAAENGIREDLNGHCFLASAIRSAIVMLSR